MKVKSCPCCGCIDSIGIQTRYISNQIMYRVICAEINNNMSEKGCGLSTAWFLTIEEAVERWNRRTDKSSDFNIDRV